MSDIYLGTEKLIDNGDGFYSSKYRPVQYMVVDGKIIPLISPLNGGHLIKGEDDFYKNLYDNYTYVVMPTGKIIPLKDPYSGSSLIKSSNGNYESYHTGHQFTYIDNKIIPLYIPDDTTEKAHIEGNYLVGDESGRRFEIDDDGGILTPEEIKFREIKRKELEDFHKTVEDGTIYEKLDEIKRLREETWKMSREEVASRLRDSLQTTKTNEVEEEFDDKVISPIVSKTIVSLKSFLEKINNEELLIKYLIELGLNEQIVNNLNKAGGTNFYDFIKKDKNGTVLIIKREDGSTDLYMPTSKKNPKSNVISVFSTGDIRIIENHHTSVIANGIRFGEVITLDIIVEGTNINLIEAKHRIEPNLGLRVVGSPLSFHSTSYQRPMIITESGEEIRSYGRNTGNLLAMNEDGLLIPTYEDKDNIEKLKKARKMGFDEKYFTKSAIAGKNYNESNKKFFAKEEDLNNIPELDGDNFSRYIEYEKSNRKIR